MNEAEFGIENLSPILPRSRPEFKLGVMVLKKKKKKFIHKLEGALG